MRGSVGCLAVVLAAMGGCSQGGQEAPGPVPVTPQARRSALAVGTPGLVRDLAPTPPPFEGDASHPRDFAQVGTMRFFVASDSLHGGELWKTDGTPEGTVLVVDTNPGVMNGGLGELTAAHGVLYFVVRDVFNLGRLWRSDGTAGGSGPVFTDPSFQPAVEELEAVNGTLYFTASIDGGRSTHLWTSNGTREGTRILEASPAFRAPQALRGVSGKLLFTAEDGVHGREPWTSDGTPAGTVLLKDLVLGAVSSAPWSFVDAGSGFYFVSGGALWKSDGTPAGTVPLTNVLGSTPVVPGGPSLRGPGWLAVSRGTLFFSADDGSTGDELWKSDGTPAGTVPVKDLHPSGGSGPSFLCDVNGVLLFQAAHPDTGREVWKSDGTAAGTVRLTDIQPGGGTESVRGWFAVAGSRAYFFAESGGGRRALWTSDGTEAGTRELRSLTPSSAGLGEALGLADGSLLFGASDGVHGIEPWRTDGTPEGTRLLRDIDRGLHGSQPRDMMDVGGGRVLFSRDVYGGMELWSSDGSETGTRRLPVEDLSVIGGVSQRVGGVRFFTASRTSGYLDELWRSDGTPEGTFLLQTFPPDMDFITVQVEAELAGRAFFSATTPTEGIELWASDGTREGTVRVKDIRPGSASSRPYQLLTVGGTLYFTADDGVHGRELWKSDGSEAGTVLVKELVPGERSGSVMAMADLNGTLVFTARDELLPEKWVLWRLGTDGLPRKIALPATLRELHRLQVVNGTLLLFTDTFDLPELWAYDGTSESATLLAKDQFFYVSDLAAAGRVLYFLGGDGRGGQDLWRSDGTSEGTFKVRDMPQGFVDTSYAPSSMLGLADRGQVLLRSWQAATGVELWVSDGSVTGTTRVADLSPGPSSSDPRSFARSGDTVFFSADDGVHGAELWRLTLPPVVPDTTLPVLECPASVTVEATSSTGAIASWPGARVSDDVSASVPLTYSHVSGGAFPLGTTVVTVRARDEAGNEAACAFEVRVRDTLFPTVTCPADVEVQATASERPTVSFGEATASDGVMAPPTVTYSHASGSVFPEGATEVRATATDAAGNTATCSFFVTVKPPDRPEPSPGPFAFLGCAASGGSPAGLLGLLLLLAWPSLGRARSRRS
jgi:ELWxxDGT repeat protein